MFFKLYHNLFSPMFSLCRTSLLVILLITLLGMVIALKYTENSKE